MRKVSFAVAVGILLAGCGGGDENTQPKTAATPPPATATATATAEAPKEEPKPQMTPAQAMQKTMMEYAAALKAHDAKKVASFYTDDAVLKAAGMPDVNGRDGVQQMWQRNFDTFANSNGGATRVFVKGDVAITEWVFSGTHAGDMGPIKATEKPVGVAGADVMWFTPEGLIKEQHTYMDMGTIMGQIGVAKQKVRPIAPPPTTPPQVVTATGADTEQKNVDAANKMMAAFEKKSDADFMSGAADDIQWDDMTVPDTMKGKDAGKKYFKAMTTAFPDAKVTEQNVWGVGDFVIAEGTFTGTQKGALFGIPPKNKPVAMHGLDVIQFKDGKVVAGRSYGNSAEMMMQLGLMPMPGADKGAAPKGDAAKTGAPKTDAAKTPAPKTDAPKTDAAKK